MPRQWTTLSTLALAGMTALAAAQQPANNKAGRPASQVPPPHTHLKVSDIAPDFILRDQNNRPVKLSDFRGKKNVVLAFYVLAFTGG